MLGQFFNKIKVLPYKIWFLWSLSVVFNIIAFFIIFSKIGGGSRTLALHYNVLIGVEWYGKGINLYFLPAVGLIITLVNYALYRNLKPGELFYAPLTAFASLFVSATILAAVFFLATIN